jgi:uncharacterized protein RhaS with RHS repeats
LNYFRDYDPQMGRYVESDPIGLGGGVNTYAYTFASPVSNMDPLGLWSTEAHNAMIDAAFPNLPPSQIAAIKMGSAGVDGAYGRIAALLMQVLGDPAQHAMRKPAETADAARSRACDFIQARLARFNQMVSSTEDSVQAMAYYELGEAMHTVMDSTSPAHTEFQPWSPLHPSAHGNLPGSVEDLDHLTDALNQKTVDLMHAVINGTSCSCSL